MYIQVSLVYLSERQPYKRFQSGKRLKTGRPTFSLSFCDRGRRIVRDDKKKAAELGEFEGFRVDGETSVKIIQFADYTLIVGEADGRIFGALRPSSGGSKFP